MIQAPSLTEQSNTDYRSILENIAVGYYEVDLKGSFTFLNASHAEFFGRTTHELMGLNYREYTFQEDHQKIYEAYNYVFRTGQPIKGVEFACVSKTGEKQYLEISASPILMADGSTIGFRGTGRDVTDRRRVMDELIKSEEKYRSILENIEDSYYEVDLMGNLVFVNDALCRLYGEKKDDIIGLNYLSLMDKSNAEKTFNALNTVYTTGKPKLLFPSVITLKDGSDIHFEVSISLNKNSDGQPVGFRCVGRDVTKRKKVEAQMKRAKEAAESANQAKSNFLANMSHELRTPLNAVIGFADLLHDTDMTDTQAEYTDLIKKSGTILISLMNDILDFSKIEAKGLDLKIIDFDPELIIHDVVDMNRTKNESKSIELYCRIGDTVPYQLKGDPLRFRQVITNLLGNACKFTEKGDVEIDIQVEAETEHRIQLHTTVRDTGIGINPQALPRIFDAFEQADDTHSRKYGGTGLGLAICRKIARLMDGDVWAESAAPVDHENNTSVEGKGIGSVFHFMAWFDKSKEKRPESVFSIPLPGLRVLLVDPHPTSQNILTHLFKNAGMIPVTVENGAGVIPALKMACETGSPIDVVVVDIQLPDMGGDDLGNAVRTESQRYSSTPMIALSGTMIRDALKYQEAGYNGFLAKPVIPEKLFQMIESVIRNEKHDGPKTPKTPRKIATQYTIREDIKHSARILLVEDNPLNQKLAHLLLTKGGYRVEMANDGREAVEKFTASPDDFDLILMDIQMPVMDGLEATRIIREKGFTAVPIIALTAHARGSDRSRCLEAGMNDHITKPIQRELVYRLINDYVIDVRGMTCSPFPGRTGSLCG